MLFNLFERCKSKGKIHYIYNVYGFYRYYKKRLDFVHQFNSFIKNNR